MEKDESHSIVASCHYFVDEAGDGNIYSKYGKVIIGQDGCTRHFMLGILDVPNPDSLSKELRTLHQELLNDPYFKKIPSMQPAQRKTFIGFHAKDDVPEIRREVFKCLASHLGLRFFAIVRDKHRVREQYDGWGKRYNPNTLYDSMTKQLFRDLLHKHPEYQIFFASRGKSDRTKALRQALLALQVAQKRFEKRWGAPSNTKLNVRAMLASQHPCLQAADYILWALQRLYEKCEDRYWDYVSHLCHLVYDVDDIRANKAKKLYGTYYRRDDPLTLDKLPPQKEIEDIG